MAAPGHEAAASSTRSGTGRSRSRPGEVALSTGGVLHCVRAPQSLWRLTGDASPLPG
jgi:hypothetical protein